VSVRGLLEAGSLTWTSPMKTICDHDEDPNMHDKEFFIRGFVSRLKPLVFGNMGLAHGFRIE